MVPILPFSLPSKTSIGSGQAVAGGRLEEFGAQAGAKKIGFGTDATSRTLVSRLPRWQWRFPTIRSD